MRKPLLCALLGLAAFAASGAEVAGVKLDDKTQVESRELFNVYVIGLYLPEKKNDPAAVLALPGPKRAAIHVLRNVDAETFSEALIDGLRANTTAAEGMAISLDWTGAATQLVVNGKPAGKPIAGEDFYRALLRIWLGDSPVQDDLKKSLLGA
jgi:hypothetical protein